MSAPATPVRTKYLGLLLAAMLLLVIGARAQNAKADNKSAEPTARLQIQVTGGDSNKPVSEASVYVKWPVGRKTQELNLKTNEEGVARSPVIPQGKTLIQIVAQGWKTYGMWFDVNQAEQTIQVHLTRPSSN
jgi:hypothetical protein